LPWDYEYVTVFRYFNETLEHSAPVLRLWFNQGISNMLRSNNMGWPLLDWNHTWYETSHRINCFGGLLEILSRCTKGVIILLPEDCTFNSYHMCYGRMKVLAIYKDQAACEHPPFDSNLTGGAQKRPYIVTQDWQRYFWGIQRVWQDSDCIIVPSAHILGFYFYK